MYTKKKVKMNKFKYTKKDVRIFAKALKKAFEKNDIYNIDWLNYKQGEETI